MFLRSEARLRHPVENSRCLNPVAINGNEYVAGPWRGRGATCNVYSLADNSGVLKVYDNEDRQKKEASILTALAEGLSERILRIIASGGKYLVVKPFARHFNRADRIFYYEDAVALMDILRIVHSKEYVHRDVTTSNFFSTQIDGDPTVLLNDWGSAIKGTSEVLHEGAPEEFRAPWIQKLTKYTPRPVDDLHSFVVSCMDLTGYNLRVLHSVQLYTDTLSVLSKGEEDADVHTKILEIVKKILPTRSSN